MEGLCDLPPRKLDHWLESSPVLRSVPQEETLTRLYSRGLRIKGKCCSDKVTI
jgi:hypothetical protein